MSKDEWSCIEDAINDICDMSDFGDEKDRELLQANKDCWLQESPHQSVSHQDKLDTADPKITTAAEMDETATEVSNFFRKAKVPLEMESNSFVSHYTLKDAKESQEPEEKKLTPKPNK